MQRLQTSQLANQPPAWPRWRRTGDSLPVPRIIDFQIIRALVTIMPARARSAWGKRGAARARGTWQAAAAVDAGWPHPGSGLAAAAAACSFFRSQPKTPCWRRCKGRWARNVTGADARAGRRPGSDARQHAPATGRARRPGRPQWARTASQVHPRLRHFLRPAGRRGPVHPAAALGRHGGARTAVMVEAPLPRGICASAGRHRRRPPAHRPAVHAAPNHPPMCVVHVCRSRRLRATAAAAAAAAARGCQPRDLTPPAAHVLPPAARTKQFFHTLLHRRLDEILAATRPRQRVVLALDGPAPLAKLLEQRWVLRVPPLPSALQSRCRCCFTRATRCDPRAVVGGGASRSARSAPRRPPRLPTRRRSRAGQRGGPRGGAVHGGRAGAGAVPPAQPGAVHAGADHRQPADAGGARVAGRLHLQETGRPRDVAPEARAARAALCLGRLPVAANVVAATASSWWPCLPAALSCLIRRSRARASSRSCRACCTLRAPRPARRAASRPARRHVSRTSAAATRTRRTWCLEPTPTFC